MKKRGVVNIMGIPTKVLETTPEEVNDDRVLSSSDYSSYDSDTSTIYINASIQDADMKCYYGCHESLHAGAAHSGLMIALQKRFRLSDEETNALEEQIVTALTPSMHSAHPDLTKLFAKFRRTR